MRILLIGYGKMGKTLEEMITAKKYQISGIITSQNQDKLQDYILNSDVAIEFSHPEAAVNNILACAIAKVPVVCGTTGWLHQFEEIEHAIINNDSALFYASNFSIGVNIFFEINKYLARLINTYPAYQVSISETHHTQKKDAPSGTAITIAEGIIENMHSKNGWELTNGQPISNDKIPIESIREGQVFGRHSVTYHSEIDHITITHDAHNRQGFAQGALHAAEWIHGKKGVFGMSDMMQSA